MTTSAHRTSGGGKGSGRRSENNKIYANPLPLLFAETPPSRTRSILGLLGLSPGEIHNPHCEGVFDPNTRSVWVVNTRDSTILWQRGFFGKGDLSRSEPSWLARQNNVLNAGGKQKTSEEATAKRRAERKQFKIDRAKAIAAAHAEAESAFLEGRIVAPALSGPNIPSAATWKPPVAPPSPTGSPKDAGNVKDPEEPLVDIEHLQLTLQEAFFLIWSLDCLTVLDPKTREPLSLKQIWLVFQSAYISQNSSTNTDLLQPNNPFLINYVVYHHYRSLGWVVKGGIKFCVDYLLYKKGPVFSHAEFALVVCPVYEDPRDQENTTFDLHNSKPFSWSWLSTINRVNSQVQKTLILVYVTVPSRSRIDRHSLASPSCFALYSVREVIVKRFIPARMRD